MGEIRFVGTGETRGYPGMQENNCRSKENTRISFSGVQENVIASEVFRMP